MTPLEQLPKTVNKQLGGLTATPAMLADIRAAVQRKRPARVPPRPLLALCCALVLCVGLVCWAVDSSSPQGAVVSPSILDSQPAGGDTLSSGESVSPASQQNPLGALSLENAQEAPAYQNLFAQGDGANFPLVMVQGATYRMLTSPPVLAEDQLGALLCELEEYTLEPALSTSGSVSNVVQQGKKVYEISGLSGALVAAPVEGSLRVFQRVSYGGTGIIGSETLADVLCSPHQVSSLQLSGVGVISDKAQAMALMETLLHHAVYQSASLDASASQSLLIGLDNGLTLQLLAGPDTVSACGRWSCPEFFEAFYTAVEE